MPCPPQYILQSHCEALEEAVDVILEQETLSGDELLDIMERHPPTAPPYPGPSPKVGFA